MKADPKPKPRKNGSARQLNAQMDQMVRDILKRREPICVCCGKGEALVGPLEVGHFVSRTRIWVRWNLTNCNRQCHDCNGLHNSDRGPYTRYLVSHYGQTAYLDLMNQSKRNEKMNVADRLKIKAGLQEVLNAVR